MNRLFFLLFFSFVFSFVFSNISVAGSLTDPAFSQPISYWKSFNNKKFQLCKIKNKKRKPKKITKKIRVHFNNDDHELSEREEEKI